MWSLFPWDGLCLLARQRFAPGSGKLWTSCSVHLCDARSVVGYYLVFESQPGLRTQSLTPKPCEHLTCGRGCSWRLWCHYKFPKPQAPSLGGSSGKSDVWGSWRAALGGGGVSVSPGPFIGVVRGRVLYRVCGCMSTWHWRIYKQCPACRSFQNSGPLWFPTLCWGSDGWNWFPCGLYPFLTANSSWHGKNHTASRGNYLIMIYRTIPILI